MNSRYGIDFDFKVLYKWLLFDINPQEITLRTMARSEASASSGPRDTVVANSRASNVSVPPETFKARNRASIATRNTQMTQMTRNTEVTVITESQDRDGIAFVQCLYKICLKPW